MSLGRRINVGLEEESENVRTHELKGRPMEPRRTRIPDYLIEDVVPPPGRSDLDQVTDALSGLLQLQISVIGSRRLLQENMNILLISMTFWTWKKRKKKKKKITPSLIFPGLRELVN